MDGCEQALGELEAAAEPRQAIRKINYSHDGMINLLIGNRGISQNAIAAHFGYSASWVSMVMSSDAFKARLAERAAEIEDPTLRASVQEHLSGVLHRSLLLLQEKLKVENPPDNLVLRSLELSSRALGYGARETQAPPTPVSVHVHLESMKDNLISLLRRERQALEGGRPEGAHDEPQV